jgi:hypothetical protein
MGWCDDEDNNQVPALLDAGELFCPQCRCFESSLIKEFPFGGSRRLVCYKMECAGVSDMRVGFFANITRRKLALLTSSFRLELESYGMSVHQTRQLV